MLLMVSFSEANQESCAAVFYIDSTITSYSISDSTIQQTCQTHDTIMLDLKLEILKNQFSDIFKEPKELSPSKEVLDQKVPLIVGSNPINIRSYSY